MVPRAREGGHDDHIGTTILRTATGVEIGA